MGAVFGSIDPTKAGGQTVDASNATSANTGLTGGQLFARKALVGTLSGLGKGLQQGSYGGPRMPQQNFSAPQQPMVNPAYFGKVGNPYFGGS